MEYTLTTQLKGEIAISSVLHETKKLINDRSLYKFIWVQNGSLDLEIDHIPTHLDKDDVLPLTPLHHIQFTNINGDYVSLMFNSNFYCIYGHDSEVSCNGFLFQGTSRLMRFKLTEEQSKLLRSISDIFIGECSIKDDLQEEMLRIVLKRFIITCTRIARNTFTEKWNKDFDIVRQFYVLVDDHFREKKQVKDYAEMLHRSPKTLTNLFANCKLPTPLQIIHERIEAEAKRLLLYTHKSAKEISDILGFEDQATFSRFFKKQAHMTVSEYKKQEKRE